MHFYPDLISVLTIVYFPSFSSKLNEDDGYKEGIDMT